MNDLVTVIIPVYNVEEYLEICVKSVCMQTYEFLEIILVDDGSTDNSGNICDKLAEGDRRIKVIHQGNGGLAAARNTGIEDACGRFITFIDSDDYVLENYIEVLFNAISDANASFAAVALESVFEGEKISFSSIPYSEKYIFTQKEAIRDVLLKQHLTISACGKLYKKCIFDNILFPVGCLYEDLGVVYDILLASERIVYIEAPLYKYYRRPGSIMQTGFDMRKWIEVDFIERALPIIEVRYPELRKEICVGYLSSYFLTLYRIMDSPNSRCYREQIRELQKKIKKYSNGLLWERKIKKSMKVKIISMWFGIYGYYLVQSCANLLKQIKCGRRYTVV